MGKPSQNWVSHVLPHGELRELAPGLWHVTGSLPRGNIPRNMVVYQLPSGGLWIHSAIALSEEQQDRLESLGEPRILVVPCPFHRLDAAVYKERYPRLTVVCPSAARSKVSTKVPVDDTCESALPVVGIKCHAPAGIRPIELVYELPLRNGGRALVATDVLFNLSHLPGLDGMLARLIGSTGFFGITRIGRLLLLQDKHDFRAWLGQMASLPDLRILCVGHGEPLVGDIPRRLTEAAALV